MLTRRMFVSAMGLAAVGSVIGLTGCGNSSASSASKVDYKKLGDTVSSDIVDFTLNSAKLSYYAEGAVVTTQTADPYEYQIMHASNATGWLVTNTDEFALPREAAGRDSKFVASKGHVLVCLDFTVKNNDRNHIKLGDIQSDWLCKKDLAICYNGNEYQVKGYDTSNSDGDSGGFSFEYLIYSHDGGSTWYYSGRCGSMTLEAGEERTIRTVGIASFDPSSLSDPFDLKVSLLNSSKGKDEFVYSID